MSLGENIANLRKKNNLSQEQLANLLSITRQAISKYETNQAEPDIKTLSELCRIFNVSYDELIDGKRKEENKVNTNCIIDKTFVEYIVEALLSIITLILLIIPMGSISYSVAGIEAVHSFNFYGLMAGEVSGGNLGLVLGFGVAAFITDIFIMAYSITMIVLKIIHMDVKILSNRWMLTGLIWLLFISFIFTLIFLFLCAQGTTFEVKPAGIILLIVSLVQVVLDLAINPLWGKRKNCNSK